jgi:hypothetical protein
VCLEHGRGCLAQPVQVKVQVRGLRNRDLTDVLTEQGT